jgi:outer membrane lipoprotein-sorting protein
MKILKVLLVLDLALSSMLAQAAEMDMKSLMQLFANSKSVKAEFAERKFVRILDAPIESSGELLFQAPTRLEKRTKLPRAEVLLIEGNKVSIERGSFKRAMSLDDFADLASLVQSLTATFRGDQTGIEKFFSWTISGQANRWQLVLKPKSAKMLVTLREIRLAGEFSYLHTVETTLTDGDRSVMSLSRPILAAAQ